MANPMPVLPLVASTTVWPGLRSPRRSASSMMLIAKRSLTEPAGLKNSAFTYTRTCAGARLLIRIHGVSPIVSTTLSYSWPRPLVVRESFDVTMFLLRFTLCEQNVVRPQYYKYWTIEFHGGLPQAVRRIPGLADGPADQRWWGGR